MRIRMTVDAGPPLSDTLPLRDGLRDALPDIASTMAAGVRDRTLDGRDVNGQRFAPKADGSRSTLTQSGRMVESFQPETVTDRRFTLAPGRGPERRRAALHQLGRGVPERRWVGLDARQVDEATERVLDAETGKERE